MKRMAALLAVAGLIAGAVPAVAPAKSQKPAKCGSGGHIHLFGQSIPFPLC